MMILSFSRSICRGGLAALIGVTGNLIPAVFHAIVTLSAPFGNLPLEGKAIKLSGRTFLAPHRGELPEGVVQANWIFRSEATRKSSETPFRTK